MSQGGWASIIICILIQKLGMGEFVIRRIPCACVASTSMLDKPWITGIPSDKQDRYKPVTKCTYRPLLGYFNNWNIIQLSSNSTSADTFDEINQVLLDRISDNIASLAESGKYGAINTTDTSTNGFMLSCSHQVHIQFRKTQQLMEKL